VTFAEASVGVSVIDAFTVCALIVLGFPVLGKVPTLWFGRPLPVSVRRVDEQVQLHVAVNVPPELYEPV